MFKLGGKVSHNMYCMQATLDEQCAAYTPVATAAASIFFALRDLVALSHMYRFSRSAYLKIFSQALSTSAPSSQVSMRLVAINSVRILDHGNGLTCIAHVGATVHLRHQEWEHWVLSYSKLLISLL